MQANGTEAAPLAVFCDFDGTFAVQDVGSTLVRKYAAEFRLRLWERYLRKEISAWEYNIELFGSLRLSKADVDVFLESIDLDPGAGELVRWCEEHAVPFQILSDGFDYNLDRLQAIHALHFDYRANHIEIDPAGWRIAPGLPNPDCFCGTGVCKLRCIEDYRSRNPESLVVHIGNGRVSDTCGSLAADWVFAKDSLAEELLRRGVAFTHYETLTEVPPVLAMLRSGGLEAVAGTGSP